MHLAHFWHAGGVFAFEPSTGSASPAPSFPREKVEWGFLWEQRGKWFAIWKDDTSLIFQHESKQWRLTSQVQLRVTSGLFRRFKILEKGEVVFEFRYRFQGAHSALIDPTYDRIDEETDDFFLYVTTIWENWKEQDFSKFLRE